MKPSWTDSLTIYRQAVGAHVTPATWVLDVGCGHADFLADIYSRSPYVYGLDPDEHALARNVVIARRVAGVADKLPFPDDTFDLVVSAWVLEHLRTPEWDFQEIYRVLKPGGKVIFLTPNSWNYNVWIIRIVPDSLHDLFTRRLYDRQEHDTYKSFYHANSIPRISGIMKATGFRCVNLMLNGDPSYIGLNRPLFKIACGIERLLDVPVFQGARVHIIGVYEK